MSLAGKTREEVGAALAGFDREQLITLIHSLVTLDRLYTAKQIAEAEGCNKRDVLADMKAGRFVDPIFGAGFFCRARNSFRVTGSAVRAWRRSFFVQSRRVADSIPAQKNARASAEAIRAMQGAGSLTDPQTDVKARNLEQRRPAELATASRDEAHA